MLAIVDGGQGHETNTHHRAALERVRRSNADQKLNGQSIMDDKVIINENACSSSDCITRCDSISNVTANGFDRKGSGQNFAKQELRPNLLPPSTTN